MQRVRDFLKPYLGLAIFSASCKIVGTLCDLALPHFTGLIIDEGIAAENKDLIIHYGVLMLAISLFGVCMTLIAHYFAARTSQDFARDMRNALYEHAQTLTMQQLDTITTSSLITRLTNDVQQVRQLFLMTMRMIVRTPVLAIGGTVMALTIDPVLSLVLLVLLPILYVIMSYTLKATRPIYRKMQKNLDRLTDSARESLTGVKVIKSFDRFDGERKRFADRSRDVYGCEIESGQLLAFINPFLTLLMNLGILAVVWLGGFRIQIGALGTGDILAYINYLTLILNSFMNISRIFSMFTRSSVSSGRINEVFAMKGEQLLEAAEPSVEKAENKQAPALQFENVSFAYPFARKEALCDISFTLQRGKTLAVVGETGSGKSSLVNLILKFYLPQKGKILLFGEDLSSLSMKEVCDRVAAVLQNPVLFSDSIEENLRWGKRDATKEELEKACEIAQIGDFVHTLPDQYATVLSQGGKNVSGGQRQRLSIARAAVKNADLLILDDSSSALDFKTDLNLRRALEREMGDKAKLIIAQRVSSVKNADEILVLSHGCIVGAGSHEQLLKDCEIYREMARLQSGGNL